MNADDFLSSVYGNEDAPLLLRRPLDFSTASLEHIRSGINPAFLGFVPELAGDSWVTIGIEGKTSATGGD